MYKVIDKNELRTGKLVPFKLCHIKQYSHVDCAFESFRKVRIATNMINDVSELDGFDFINTNDKSRINKLIENHNNVRKLPLAKVFLAKERVSPAPAPAKSRVYGLKSSTVPAINIRFANADQLTPPKLPELKKSIQRERPKNSKERSLFDFKIPGDTIHTVNLDSKIGRGVAVYTHNSLDKSVVKIKPD